MSDYWTRLEELQVGDAAEKAVARIAEDIRDRRGIGNELEAIDDETVVDMLNTWVAIIRQELAA